MYRIGQFSLMTKVTVKTLRFYEEEGLLTPCHVDYVTGYRYYETSQLADVHKIVALKQCGFPLADIKEILKGKNIQGFLANQKKKLMEDKSEIEAQIASVSSYLDFVKENRTMNYEVVIKSLPRVLVYSCKMHVDSYDNFFDVIPKLGQEVHETNPEITCKEDPFYCFHIYETNGPKDHDINFEFCEAVNQRGKDTDRIKFKIVEGVPRAACVMHRGPYSTISHAYDAVYKWIEDNDFHYSDFPRESFIDGIWNKESEDEWLTEIQVPIE
jgi:DNA-binding transcriptional MerR regulator